MAHHKRKKSRRESSGYYSANALKHRLGDRYDDYMWMDNYPRNWDKVFHIGPRRAATRAVERAVIKGADYDNVVWPLDKKPHCYYW